jgi:hypothetical protein
MPCGYSGVLPEDVGSGDFTVKEDKMKIKSSALRNIHKFFPKVTKVTDASKKLIIEVVPKDEAVSLKKDHAGCALAVACKREYKLDGVIVSRTMAYLIKGDEAIRYSLPESASREIVSFDRGGGFEPGSYELNKPDRKLGDGHGSGTGHGRAGGLTIKHRMTTNVRSVLGAKET